VTNNFYILFHLASYLKKNLPGKSIADIYSQEKNKIIFSFGNSFLEFSVENKLPYLVLKDNQERAHKNSVTLFAQLIGQTVSDVSLFGNDRIICFSLSGGYRLLFIFIPTKYNLLLVSEDNQIIDSFKKIKTVQLTEYLKTKVYPMKKASTSSEYIQMNYPKTDKSVRRDIVRLNDINIFEAPDEKKQEEIRKIFSDAENKMMSGEFGLREDDSGLQLALKGMPGTKEFPDINSMLIYYIRNKMNFINISSTKERLLHELQQKIVNIGKKINNLRQQLVRLEMNEEMMIKGNLILSNLPLIENYTASVKLTDPTTEEEWEIKLDSKKSAIENAQNYFRRYKMGKEAIDTVQEKINYYEMMKDELERKAKDIEAANDYKSIKKMNKENVKEKQSGETDSLFRKFRIDEQFEIWIGKDSRTNDLLTTKYSSPNDLWFHIHGFSGSHTVLKKNSKDAEVPKEYIRYAASLAAYYSKARNAGTVPVAYCERKYVKKQKGFKEGSVIMEREKLIYVKPEIPDVFQKFLSRS
jgi:predicted ribosome quality control (RQC) complex YloA/Tae2 family protein